MTQGWFNRENQDVPNTVPDYLFKVSTVPEFAVREAGVHFALGFSEDEILNRLANTEKIVLVALYARVVRTQTRSEERVKRKVHELSRFSKRDLVEELVELVNLTRTSLSNTNSFDRPMDQRPVVSHR